jgi:hypothetical protein
VEVSAVIQVMVMVAWPTLVLGGEEKQSEERFSKMLSLGNG